MVMTSLNQALFFLVDTAASFYLFALMIYLLLRWQNVSFANPLMPTLAKISKPITMPLRPLFAKQTRADVYSLIIGIVLLQMAFIYFSVWFRLGVLANVLGVLLLAVGELLALWINICFYSILIGVILSWVAPLLRNSFTWTIDALSEPVLQPFRQWIPPMGGIDFSPMVALLALQALKIFAVRSLLYYGSLYLLSN